MKKRRSLRASSFFFFLLLLSLLTPDFSLLASFAGSDSTSKTVEAKLALESSLEKRLKSLLTEILATDDVLVIISVELRNEEEQKQAEQEVMPGVPQKETPGTPGALAASLTMVKRIQSTVIVDRSTSDSDIQLIRKVTAGLLGLSVQRGDSVAIEKMEFRKSRPLSWQDFSGPDQIWKLFWFLLAAAGLILLYMGFLTPALSVGRDIAGGLRSRGASTGEGGPGEIRPESPPGTQAPWAADGSSPREAEDRRDGLPFSFVRPEHLPRLLYLLRQCQPEHVAMILHYLPPDMASRILAAQSDANRAKIAQSLTQVTELVEKTVRDVEQWVRSRIDFLVGGEEKLLELLERLPPDLQQEVLSQVSSRDPFLKDRLQARVVCLEDLAGLEAGELQIVMRRLPLNLLARVLKTEPDLTVKIQGRLPAALSERLNHEVAFAPNLSGKRLEAEVRQVVEAMKALSQEGLILIKREPEAAGLDLPSNPPEGGSP